MVEPEKEQKKDSGGIQVIKLEDYLREQEGKPFRKNALGLGNLPAIKRIGFWLAVIVAFLILVATVWILIDFELNNPLNHPAWKERLSQCCDDESMKSLQVYREIQNVTLDRFTRLFTMLVASTLLPLLTSVIGYLFGSRQVENAEDKGT